jgi:hypothetical protein
MTHARPNTAYFKVQITIAEEDQSKATEHALVIKRKNWISMRWSWTASRKAGDMAANG